MTDYAMHYVVIYCLTKDEDLTAKLSDKSNTKH